jgi:hypothetical protein
MRGEDVMKGDVNLAGLAADQLDMEKQICGMMLGERRRAPGASHEHCQQKEEAET